MEIKLVKMEESDIEAMVETERAVFTAPWTPGMFRQELTNALAYYIVAKAGDRVAGHGGLWTVFDEGHITNIAVRPEYQRQGVASQILKNFLEFAQEYEMSFLTLEVRRSNHPAIELYRKFGFEEAGMRKEYYEDNREDAVIMTLYLKQEKGGTGDGNENFSN